MEKDCIETCCLCDRKHMAKTRIYLVNWWLSMSKACKEIILFIFVLMLAANILLFTLARKTFHHLGLPLMQG